MTEMHVWVGYEDPFKIPIGGVTLVIHQGTAPIASGSPHDSKGPSDDNVRPAEEKAKDESNVDDTGVPIRIVTQPLKDPTPGGGTYILKDPTPGGGTYINLMRDEGGISISDQIELVLDGRAGMKVGIELPDLVVGGPIGRDVFMPILDGLRTRPNSDLKVHLIRTSDFPIVDE